MNLFDRTWWVLRQGLEGAFLMPRLAYFSWGVLALWGFYLIWDRPFGRAGIRRPWNWLCLVLFAFAPVSALVGGWGEMARVSQIPAMIQTAKPWDPQPSGPEQTWALYALNTLFFGQIVYGALAIWRMKGYRRFGFCTALLGFVMNYWVSFVAGMAITGDWI